MEDVYRQFNHVESEIAPKEAQVAGYEKEIEILSKNADEERNRIANDKLKLVETEAKIRDLENQLRNLRDRKAALEASIKNSEAIIADAEAQIEDARQKIRDLEAEIRRLRDQADSLRSKSNELEIKVERLRTDITVAETKEERFERQIEDLNDRINIEEKKLADEELDDLERQIAVLKRLVPTTESEIDRHYYYCFGDGAVEVEKTGSTVVYVVRGERVNGYLQRQYGANAPAYNGGDIHLRPLSIFDAQWTNKFGYPFVNTDLSGNSLDVGFNCLNPSAVQHGYGTIAGIGSDYIDVNQKNGGHRRLKLGSCSRVESNQETPKIGQGIYYSAVPSSADGFNLYAATCL